MRVVLPRSPQRGNAGHPLYEHSDKYACRIHAMKQFAESNPLYQAFDKFMEDSAPPPPPIGGPMET